MSGYDVEALKAKWGERLHFHEELTSTNLEALSLTRKGVAGGTIVLAEKQTQGRGRRGASWFCGEGKGLAFSLIVRPTSEPAVWARLALVTGLAVAQALEKVGVFPEIKWPNDVLIAGKKVCGILVESEGKAVVIGVGLNVNEAEMPIDLRTATTSLEEEGARVLEREYFLNEIVQTIVSLVPDIEGGFSELLRSVRSRCALQGKSIRFLVGNEEHLGECQGIGESGELLVREDGEVRRYFAAEQISFQ